MTPSMLPARDPGHGRPAQADSAVTQLRTVSVARDGPEPYIVITERGSDFVLSRHAASAVRIVAG